MEKLRRAIARFDTLSLRERLLILVTVVVAVALPTLLYLIEPAQQARAKLTTASAKMEAENAQLVLELATLTAQSKTDPNRVLQDQVDKLQQTIDQLNATLQVRAAQLIAPQEMLTLLEQVLTQQGRLQLVSLEKGAPTRFQLAEAPAASDNDVGIFRHDLTLVVEGGFFEVLSYLQALEQLPKSFFWDGLDYQVVTYPRARVSLRVHTLSSAEGWLGV